MGTKNILYFFLFFGIFGYSQKQNIWKSAKHLKFNKSDLKHRSSTPKSYKIYQLNLEQLKLDLTNAPKRESHKNSSTIIYFPMSNGKLERFKVYKSSIMHPDLQAKYPNIKTYAAQGIDDPTATMRFSITQFGLHTMTLSGKHNAEYIDPYTTDTKYYIAYNRTSIEEYRNLVPFECTTEQGYHLANNYTSNTTNRNTNDQVLRTYRLAQSCTAEYGNIFTSGNGTDAQNKADIQAQMTITINRVNEIFERDLAITLQFIPNNDALIYYGNTNSDPWSNEWNNTTQTVIDNTIGDANYDIGHNFNTTGGGNAGCLACVCISGSKGSGYTGRSDPTGDPFDIDYVAHEMGHQFGGYHTMNSCNRSGNGSTEVEPASGSSIMGYAGICATNVQSNSDAHFNYVNIRDISTNIQTGNSTCGVQTVLNNNAPTANAGADYTIPANTAFVLEGIATDADGTASLTYNWSQNDPEQAPNSGTPQSNWVNGPLYRAKLPITSLKRYLPRFTDVRTGNLTPTWEVTPSVSRNMEFSFIVRDNFVGGGQTASDLMNVTVNANGSAFTVTSQTTAQTWQVGSSQTITWDVGNTNIAPISTPNVDIYLTEDGETLIPVLLNTPNDGTENITVPSGLISTTARIMVKGNNNIFYAINSANITIEAGSFTMTFANTNSNICLPNDAIYTFTYNTFNGFNETTTFSATGIPAGAIATFNPSQANTNSTTVTLTISGITSTMIGNYNIIATGTTTSTTVNSNLTLNIKSGTYTNINLLTPTNNAIDVSTGVQFSWSQDTNAETYSIEIASDNTFTNIIDSVTQSTTTFNSNALNLNTTYYWRVIYSNTCSSTTSPVFSFTTQTGCTICISEGDMNYATSITNVSFNTINNDTAKPTAYSDYTNISTDVFKNNNYDLSVSVNTDGNYTVVTKVWIDWNQDCDFNDPGEEYDLGSANNTANGTTTNSPLSILVPNTAVLGNTRMRVSTKYTSSNIYSTSCQTNFDGEVEDYTINIKLLNDTCVEAFSLQTGFVFTDYSLTTTNVGATASGVTASISCIGFGSGEDVWYAVTIPQSGNITIETQAAQNSNLADTVMSVFEGTCGNLTEFTCDDDDGVGLFSLVNITNRTPGEILYVRIWEYENNIFDTFLISAYDNNCSSPTTIWNGTSWSNGTPNINTPAIINGNYNNGSFSACELVINEGFVMTLNTGDFLDIQNNIQNNGVLNSFENSGIKQNNNVGIVSGTGIFNTEIKTTPLVDNDRFTYFSSPTINESLTVFTPWAQMNRIWKFNDATQHWNLLNGNETMISGKGYAVKPNVNLNYTTPITGTTMFTKKLFNGTLNTTLYYNVGQQEPDATDDDSNLIGNPYPSAIDAAMLLSNNANASAFYFWTHNTAITNNSYGDDYSIWNNSGGVASGSGAAAPTGIIARGQGFFVLATASGTFNFDNSYRTNSTATFIRDTNNEDKLWLNLTNQNNDFSQILIAFSQNGTDNYDNHFDAPRISLNSAPISLYSFGLSANKYGIQTRSPIENETTIPLGVKILNSDSNNFEIAIDHFENMEDTSIYLKDNLLNIIYDLKISNYNFTITNFGEFNTRFELIFSKNALNISDNATFENVIISNNTTNLLHFYTTNTSNIESIEIFDLLGKRIISKKTINTSNYDLNIDNINLGTVLIIKTTLKNGRIFNSKYILR